MEYLIYIHIGNVVAQKSAIIDKYITLTNLLYLIPTVLDWNKKIFSIIKYILLNLDLHLCLLSKQTQ